MSSATSKARATAGSSSVDQKISQAQLSKNELERVTEVFKMYETGLGEATMYPKDLSIAMKKLGLNPTETEIQDLINEIEVNGFIYYQAFCRVVMRKLREDDEENFHQELFRTLVGPKQFPPGSQATIYNVNKEFLTLEQFKKIMTSLPEAVDEAEAEDMFSVADKDGNGRINYNEFRRMCVVPKAEPIPEFPGGGGGGNPEPVDTVVVANGVMN